MDNLVQFGLVLGVAAVRGSVSTTRAGFGLADAFAGVGLNRLGGRKLAWLAGSSWQV